MEYKLGLFGSVVLGALSAILGGLVRGVLCQIPPILLHRETIGIACLLGAWLEDSYLLIAVLIAVVLTNVFKSTKPVGKFILVLDSISLGIAVVAAVDLAMEYKLGLLGSVVLGALSAILGGLVRDVNVSFCLRTDVNGSGFSVVIQHIEI